MKHGIRQTTCLLQMIATAMWLFCLPTAGEAQTIAVKPPVGAVLNPQHPLANGLIVCPLINEGSGQSLWESGTQQAFIMDNPLVWGSLPGTAQVPWAGPTLQFNGTPGATMGPGCRMDVSSIPFFRVEPDGATGITVAYLWSPNTGVAQSARRIGDTDKTSVYTIYESISGQANKWTYTYRDAATNVFLKHFAYTVGDWIFSVVCIKEGECTIYTNGVLASTSANVNFHTSWWQGNAILPIWWHMTEGPFFYATMDHVVFDGSIAGAWMWNRYLTQADVTSLVHSPWGMFTYTNTLTVTSEHGGMEPGSVATNFGAVISCLITNSPVTGGATQYVANGGAVLSNVFTLVNATNITLTLTNHATLIWAWKTNVFLTLGTNGAGAVDQTNGWRGLGSNVIMTATASNYWQFTGWSGDTNGCVWAGNVVTVLMTQARSIAANFAPLVTVHGTPYRWLALYGLLNFEADDTDNSTDGDGMPPWQEYLAGTDPTNPRSVFAILAAGRLDVSNYITFYGTTNSGVTSPFSIFLATNLSDGSGWYLIGTNIPRSANGTNTWWHVAPPASVPLFYRPAITN